DFYCQVWDSSTRDALF
nr:immunoglobulin light chain junction region [Macaca mulatta]MOW05766.1 immunoglobulin light chain junction region [Macaca mulatta]